MPECSYGRKKALRNNRFENQFNEEGSGVFVQQAIAILDSGVGGLTVAKEVMRQAPAGKDHLFWGYCPDTVRTPFVRTSKTIYGTNR